MLGDRLESPVIQHEVSEVQVAVRHGNLGHVQQAECIVAWAEQQRFTRMCRAVLGTGVGHEVLCGVPAGRVGPVAALVGPAVVAI